MLMLLKRIKHNEAKLCRGEWRSARTAANFLSQDGG